MKNLALIGCLCFLSACTVVGPGARGVRVSLGTVSEDPKPPGAYLWVPFLYGMVQMNVQVQKSDITSTAATRDMQDVNAHVAVNWSLAPENVVKTYKNIGDENDVANRILLPAVSEVLKSATAMRTAEEVLTHRMQMKADIDNGLKERLAHYGITLEDVSIVNLTFSAQFTQAIEHKQIAEQQAKQAEYDALKAIQQAKSEVNRAQGQATAQGLLRSTLTKEMLEKMAIEKWDGKLPTVTSGATPFIDLRKVN